MLEARPDVEAEDMENREKLQPMVDGALEWVRKLQWGGEDVIGK